MVKNKALSRCIYTIFTPYDHFVGVELNTFKATFVWFIPGECLIHNHIHMSRSVYKGPYVDVKLLKKIEGKKPLETGVIKTWARASMISPEMIGFTFGVHNGKKHIEVLVSEDMVGHRLGEFSPTKTFHRHGGKMQKELDQKKKQAEIAAAKSASASSASKTGAKKK